MKLDDLDADNPEKGNTAEVSDLKSRSQQIPDILKPLNDLSESVAENSCEVLRRSRGDDGGGGGPSLANSFAFVLEKMYFDSFGVLNSLSVGVYLVW